MYWKITKDHLYDGKIITKNYTGKTLGNIIVGDILMVRLYDDDDELYYEAHSDDEGLESLYEWALIDSGTVCLKIWDKGAWKVEIA